MPKELTEKDYMARVLGVKRNPVVDMSRFKVLKLEVTPHWGPFSFEVALKNHDVCRPNDSEPTWVRQNTLIPNTLPQEGPAFAQWLKGEILRLLAHEIEECMYIDGKPMFDPHGVRGENDD